MADDAAASGSSAAQERAPCGRRKHEGVEPRPVFDEAEVAALIFLVQRHLPRILATGGRASWGYSAEERRQRWDRVRRRMRRLTGVERPIKQIQHRWSDIISREPDLLEMLSVEVEGPGQCWFIKNVIFLNKCVLFLFF